MQVKNIPIFIKTKPYSGHQILNIKITYKRHYSWSVCVCDVCVCVCVCYKTEMLANLCNNSSANLYISCAFYTQ